MQVYIPPSTNRGWARYRVAWTGPLRWSKDRGYTTFESDGIMVGQLIQKTKLGYILAICAVKNYFFKNCLSVKKIELGRKFENKQNLCFFRHSLLLAWFSLILTHWSIRRDNHIFHKLQLTFAELPSIEYSLSEKGPERSEWFFLVELKSWNMELYHEERVI